MKFVRDHVMRQIFVFISLLCISCTHMPIASESGSSSSALYVAARAEGQVSIYSVLSNNAAQPLIDDFQMLYPGIVVNYDGEKGSTDMEARYRSETHQDGASADVVWSSATDMQMQLVLEGYAASYRSPEANALPDWANYQDQAYGTTLEPVVIVYNKKMLDASDVPQSHDDLIEKLWAQPKRYRGKVTGFDIRTSGVGYMFAAQDQAHFVKSDMLLDALGKADFTAGSGTGEMLTGIQNGKYLIGYNMMGAYALSRSQKDLPDLAVVFPSDYTLLLSRVAFVSKKARHPNAARLWLDYLLSARGQAMLGNQLGLFPVHEGINANLTATKLLKRIGKGAKPVPLTPSTAASLNPDRKAAFIANWGRRTGAESTEK